MSYKLIFIGSFILSYIMIAFTYGLNQAKKVHHVNLKDVKNEIPNGILLRGICSLIYFFCIIDWMFDINLIPWAYLPFKIYVNYIGLITLFLTVALFWWIHITLGSNYHGPLKIHEKHVLIKNGPYAIVRHPTYVAFPLFHISIF